MRPSAKRQSRISKTQTAPSTELKKLFFPLFLARFVDERSSVETPKALKKTVVRKKDSSLRRLFCVLCPQASAPRARKCFFLWNWCVSPGKRIPEREPSVGGTFFRSPGLDSGRTGRDFRRCKKLWFLVHSRGACLSIL